MIATAQVLSPESEIRFCAGSNHAHGVSELCNMRSTWQWFQLENKVLLSRL